MTPERVAHIRARSGTIHATVKGFGQVAIRFIAANGHFPDADEDGFPQFAVYVDKIPSIKLLVFDGEWALTCGGDGTCAECTASHDGGTCIFELDEEGPAAA